ncbi:precorrin-6Y C(5,15)-methyltransferase [mine drainage metagenome]|uniref:Precorrin-6Y C(5,15)-methyltransferase n=1 Tax=mine drainage metagenome TaxID=410659 RepID=A0A1J5SYN5_9ZZZZ
MNPPWLAVIGLGDDGLEGLAPAARALLDTAELIVGGARHLALLPPGGPERMAWTSPFADSLPRLLAWRGRRVCVLASGDPQWFGAGVTLARAVPPDEMTILPHPGAFSLAAARLGWALQDCRCLTAHGRPLEALPLHFHPGARLLVLSENRHTPARLAALLCQRGWGTARLSVLEHLGGAAERRLEGTAEAWPHAPGADLNTIAVALERGPALPLIAGLPDALFRHDGQLTKREARAVTLAALAPWPGAVLWDLGAGCGSIAIEWARAGGRAVAVERDAARRALIAHNAAALGVPDLEIVAGTLPAALEGLAPAPDAVFIGGGLSETLLKTAWALLPPGGRLVCNSVTAESEALLLAWQASHGGDMMRLAVSRLEPVGRFHGWQPLRPVTQYVGLKA